MPTWVFTIFGWLKKVYDLAKLAGAYLIGRAHQRKKQEEAADAEIQDQEDKRDAVRNESDQDLRDRLSGRDRK